jgi:transposase
MDDPRLDPKADDLRRFEVITGVGRRRRWPVEVKARIVAESFAVGAPVSEVARRHGLRPQQLFGWRREARLGRLAVAGDRAPAFVPIMTSDAGGSTRAACGAAGSVEIELRGLVVRVHGRVEAAALAEVLAAVKSVA